MSKSAIRIGMVWAAGLLAASAARGAAPLDVTWNIDGQAIEFRCAGDTGGSLTLMSYDGPEFVDVPADEWGSIATSNTGVVKDAGDGTRPAPLALDDGFRFYKVLAGERAALLSYRVVTLQPGENWMGLWGEPIHNAIGAILGRALPAGASEDASTRVRWYRRAGYPEVAQALWLDAQRGWRSSKTGETASDIELPTDSGFVVTLPASATPVRVPILLRVPGHTPMLDALQRGAYQIMNSGYPRSLKVADLGLKQAGFHASYFSPTASDELRILGRGTGSDGRPVARILLDPMDQQFKFWTGGPRGTNAGDFTLNPAEAVIVYAQP